MSGNEYQNIIISDHFEMEQVKLLFDTFVVPYQDVEIATIKPRRILGNYLTYLITEEEEQFSVMIKKVNNQIQPQCTCSEFNNKSRCIHIAQVLTSMERQINEELHHKKIQIEVLENKKKHYDEAKLKKSALLAKLNDQIHEIIEKTTKSSPVKAKPNHSNLPFIIKNARDFSLIRLYNLLPSLKYATRRGKTFVKSTVYKDGFKLAYKTSRVHENIQFKVNEQDDIEIKCSCGETVEDNICTHALDCIFYLADVGSYSQFLPFINQDREKNRLLEEFGLTLQDTEARDFKFSTDYLGRVSINFIPPKFVSLSRLVGINDAITKDKVSKKIFRRKIESHRVGIFFQLTHANNANNPLKIEAFKIEPGKKGEDKYTRVLIGKEENESILAVMEDDQLRVLMDFSFLVFKDFIGAGYYTQTYNLFTTQHFDVTRKLYLKYFVNKLEEHWKELATWEDVKFLPEGDNFAKSNLEPLKLVSDPIYPKINVGQNEKFIYIKISFTDADGEIVIGEDEELDIYRGKIIHYKNQLFLNNNNELVHFLTSVPKGVLLFSVKYADSVMKEVLHPLYLHHGIAIPDQLALKVKELPLVPLIYLKEFQDKFLMIAPKFGYDDHEIEMNDPKDVYLNEEGEQRLLVRNKAEEDDFVEYIRSTHPQFRLQLHQAYFSLPFDEVMRHHWFIDFSKQLMADGIKMIGFNELKKFKFNGSTPKWDMKVSSGIDWFDIKVSASWGDQVMGFKDIRKAIMNGQSFVVLGDGSFGMLPEEWIKKYSNLFKFGIDEKDGLKVSKKQFNIVEMLFDQIDDADILAEIEEKKRKLLYIEDVKTQPIPANINAQLRPYQETGYQWMQVLDEISWGGCLADDMGLGKTLQTITFLSYIKDKYNGPTSLIICPTSLIYNWESELKKFAPELKYHIFYGLGRTFSDEHFNDYDIIISSYGIVRNDIETLVKFQWEYVILDESQAIKNPDAISTKAVQLLQARNKFILSGTPLQNNTFDIFAQFNFLNPGLLGGKEFFRQEFANPIDKNGDKDAGMMLRKLIKPFMLRRTKAEVATDLPEKTETILWCQMDKNQKTLYDEYKDYYRHALMQKIETDGIAKSGVYILEGLLRLRQICDDPRLVKDKDTKPFKGVKIKELVREIQENMGNHKMLVFSQFTEMLALIREEMNENKIKYCYLDGSTPATQRREQVDIFQSDADINVFLISLKAGGVGLNLTEADYVYIVDPWWNPAVEQQAIDRTHRIGQKNKIFAYKMICKDSVEEKIITLQEKKLSISKEIVQEDTAFFKSLSKDDISFLFS
ncbi:MAG: hypothetical protein KA234_08865 [Saprospiraceae bacterium]|nr:hypothetical protein [Saprospiraceae bacterium]